MIAKSRTLIDRPWWVEMDGEQMWLLWEKRGAHLRVAVRDLDHALKWAESINRGWSHEWQAWANRQAARNRVVEGLR